MSLFAIAIPVLPEQADRFQKFIEELNGDRNKEFVLSRQRKGVRERTFLQHSPMGDFVIATFEGDDPVAAFASFGLGTDDFSQWFNEEVAVIHGVDLKAPPEFPLPELIIDTAGR